MNELSYRKFIDDQFEKIIPLLLLMILSLIKGSHIYFLPKFIEDIPPLILETLETKSILVN